APIAHEDDAERAVRAGLALVRHGHRLRIEDDPAFPGLHVGINTGEVIVGGSRESSGLAVVGDVVNISARLVDMAAAGQLRVGVDEPGVGKSRLVEELARRRSDALVMRGACLPYGQRLPLAALAEAITEQLGIRGDWSPARVRRAIAALRDSPAGDVSGPA